MIVKSGLESDYCSTWAGRVSVREQAVVWNLTLPHSAGGWLLLFWSDIRQTLTFSIWATSEQLLGE